MSQTSIQRDFSIAFAGMKSDSRFDHVDTGIAEGAIGFGLGVEPGTDPERQVQLVSGVNELLGVALHKHKEQSTAGAQDAAYADTEAVSVLRKGTVWMPIEDSQIGVLAARDVAYINVAIGGAELGKVTGVSTANIPTGGRVKRVDDALGLAEVEINLP